LTTTDETGTVLWNKVDTVEQSPLQRPLKELIGADVRVKIVDIGANMIDSEPPYAPLLRAGAGEVVGFEPNLEALDRLNAQKTPAETYLPHALGDGARHRLRFCAAQGMTSLLPPNPRVLNLFHGFPEWGRVVREEDVDTARLDDVPETEGVDLLKMDIQGAELMVLRAAEKRLETTLVIQTEVEFLPMYEGQPLFSEVEMFLRERGFLFHRFFPTVSRVLSPMVVDNNVYAGLSQLLWADAIFVRDFTDLSTWSDRSLAVAAEILHDCYQSIDLVLRLLNEGDSRSGTARGAAYLTALTGKPAASA